MNVLILKTDYQVVIYKNIQRHSHIIWLHLIYKHVSGHACRIYQIEVIKIKIKYKD